MSRPVIAAAAVALALGAAACGEKPTVTFYKQGQYQGKPDQQPWANDIFKGDKLAWEKAIRARNDGQNEYTRLSAPAN